MPVVHSGIEKNVIDELAVTLPYQDLVISKLPDMPALGDKVTLRKSSDQLSLGLIKLRYAKGSQAPATDPRGSAGSRHTQLDRVLADDIVAVGAHDSHRGGRAPCSPNLPWITLSSPGVNVVSASLNDHAWLPYQDGVQPAGRRPFFGGDAAWSGTSFAAAAVSGEIATRNVPGRQTTFEAGQQLLHSVPNRVASSVDIRPYNFSADRPA